MTEAWAVLRSHLDTYRTWAMEQETPFADADPDAVEAMYAARGRTGSGSVAIVPILGPITHRDTLMTMAFGGTSTNRLTAQFQRLSVDETVSRVLLNIDSPGGEMGGLVEASAALRALRDVKPVTALVNTMAASAAYWLAAQATEIVAAPESLTGSVGVRIEHWDMSGFNEQMGIDVTHIATPPEKVDVNFDAPLTDSARAELQGIVDSGYALFVSDIAKGRGITAKEVRDTYTARVLDATEAKAAGMVDRIATYTETVGRLAGARKAEAPIPETVGEVADIVITADMVDRLRELDDAEAAADAERRDFAFEVERARGRLKLG